jgi:hypothetical protein
MPDETSRRLLETLRLEICYDPASRIARCSITLTGDTIDAVSRTSQEVMAPMPSVPDAPDKTLPEPSAHNGDGLCSAPRGLHAEGCGRDLRFPVGRLVVEGILPLPGNAGRRFRRNAAESKEVVRLPADGHNEAE